MENKKYKPQDHKRMGVLDATLSAFFGTQAILGATQERYVNAGAQGLASIAMGYESSNSFREGVPSGKGFFLASCCLGISGIEKIAYGISEEKYSNVVNGILDFAIGGMLIVRYLLANKLNRMIDERRKSKDLEEQFYKKDFN